MRGDKKDRGEITYNSLLHHVIRRFLKQGERRDEEGTHEER